MSTVAPDKAAKSSGVVFYLVVFLGIALFVATPFVALRYPWSLALTVPAVLAWGVYVLNGYWRWVRSL